MQSYDRPETIESALAILARNPCTIIAGGTDIYPALATAQAWGKPTPMRILDISALPRLDQIFETDDALRFGCRVTWTQILQARLPDWFEVLRLAAREVGGVQIQNRGTVVGNLCNASPAADGIPALLVLDAQVELTSHDGRRQLPLANFVTGNRQTARKADELLTAIIIPKRVQTARSCFLKLGARNYLVISIVMVAGLIETDAKGRIAAAHIAVGSCSEVAQRLPALEAALLGRHVGDHLADAVTETHLAGLSPIDDPRGSADYRRHTVLTLLRRLLWHLGQAP